MSELKTKVNISEGPGVIPMNKMKPLDIGVIIEDPEDCYCHDHVVMRTTSLEHFEVIDLTYLKEGSYWTEDSKLKVRLLPSGTQITINIIKE